MNSPSEVKIQLKDKNINEIEKILSMKNTVTQEGFQTSTAFVDQLIIIKQRTQMLEKHIFAKRAELTEEEYKNIEKIGDLHYDAQTVNENSGKDKIQISLDLKCKCGCESYAGDSLPYCENLQEKYFLGPGILLFFYYAKRILILISIAVLIYGVFALVTNIVGQTNSLSCQETPGGLPFLCEWKKLISISNKGSASSILYVQVWLAIPVFILWAIGVRFIRDIGRVKNKEIDQKLDSSSDYCVWMEDLPAGDYHQTDILVFLSKLWRARKDKIHKKLVLKSVQIIYKTDVFRSYLQKLREIGGQLYNMIQVKNEQQQEVQVNQTEDGLEVQRIRNRRKIVPKKQKKKISHEQVVSNCKFIIDKEEIEKYKEKKTQFVKIYEEFCKIREQFLKDKEMRKKMSSDTVLVEFFEKQSQEEFLKNYGVFQQSKFKQIRNKVESMCKEDEKNLTFKGKNIKMFRAPEPSDINWANAQKQQSNFRILAVWMINITLILLTFGVLVLYWYLASISELVARANFIKILVLNLFNRLIWNILNSVIAIEQNKTKTQSMVSVMNKSYIAQSFNIIVLPIVMNINFGNNSLTGLEGSIHDYQLTSFIFMTFLNLINMPFRISSLLMCIPITRRMLIKYYCRVTEDLNSIQQISQIIKQIYQPPKLPTVGFYVYITSIINQAFFFCYIHPVLLFYLLFNAIFFYFMNRHLLLRRCKMPQLLDFFIFEVVIIYAMNVPLFYGVGSLVLLYLGYMPVQNASTILFAIPSIIVIVIWFVSFQNPFNIFQSFVQYLEQCLWGKQFEDLSSKAGNQENDSQQKVNENEQQQNEEENQQEQTINKRRQNFYKSSPMTAMFNFESQVFDVQGSHHNKLKNFCNKFSFNMRRNREKRNKLNIKNL